MYGLKLSSHSIALEKLRNIVAQVLDFPQSWHENENWWLVLVIFVSSGDLVDDEADWLKKFFVCARVFLIKNDSAPSVVDCSFWQEFT